MAKRRAPEQDSDPGFLTPKAKKAPRVLVEEMQQHADDADAQEQACRALAILMEENDANQTRIGDAGGPEAVVTAMRQHADVAAVQEQACAALWVKVP